MKRGKSKFGFINKAISLYMAYVAVRRFLDRGRRLRSTAGVPRNF